MRRLSYLLFCCAVLAASMVASAQSGPWAKYDADFKGGALLREASAGNLAEVRSIVEGGADVNWGAASGESTPLMSAAMAGHLDVVDFLLEQGADPTLRWKFNGMNALELARMNGHAAVVARLQGASQGLPPPGARPANAGQVAPPAAPAPAPARAAVTGTPGRGGWPAFGTYRVGDRVMWRQSNGWFTGTVSEVGVAGPNRGRAEPHERKYRIADDRWSGAGDWWDWGLVAGREREPWWTGFFVGQWQLGEVMAVNDRAEAGEVHTEFAYHGAADTLEVGADGSYVWTPMGGTAIRGRWEPAPDGPGIVLRRGVDGADWTFVNETNATEENIRGIQTARLRHPTKMSIAARRPLR